MEIAFSMIHRVIGNSCCNYCAQTDITVGSSLTAVNGNSSWLSPSGDFAFGFRSLYNGNNAKDERLFLLSIWYNKIPSKTVVWFANGDRPAPENSKLALTSNLGLVLTNSQGEELWKLENILGDVSHAIFNDTEEIFSRGKFQLGMLGSGDLVLNTINLPSSYANDAYSITKTAGDSNGSASSGKELVFSNSGSLFVSKENGGEVNLSQEKVPLAADFYLRVTLDFDGVLTQYYHPRNSSTDGSWSILWTQPENICSAVVSQGGNGREWGISIYETSTKAQKHMRAR
ncbi:G-type lectin S-receptor-like serine/threonine-protein kinase LECRK2 [Eucalyptus grandis]|uniref:G-type lectin S-receptor-like serine/threonine-protein kinase LECRK2 n=1 Tax=Eucalyptus grandis TaxID=71139 RepID=UPI00192ECE39|nr:G-type lectin S-receptor-like serine/threonine-protein kinase LECRK2 [Eucalyptus grandis]